MTPEQQELLPEATAIEKLVSLDVKSQDGSSINFKSLVNDATHPRVLTIFIRHFFCGFCEEYLKALMKELPPATLENIEPKTKLIVIGCGDSSHIPDYKKRTGCEYEMYADYTRATYDALGFVVTLATGHKQPDYSDRSFGSVVLSSIFNNVFAGRKLFSGGKVSQNGGELVWLKGELQSIHRMATTQDHLSIPDLKKRIGL